MIKESLTREALELLDALIAIPSVSREEDRTALCLQSFLQNHGIREVHRLGNNLYVRAAGFDEQRPTLLLNSHHDTVKPSASYTRDPFSPSHEEGRIYGLGSNDAGASVVSLVAAFRYFYERTDLPFNLLLALSAEEEVQGAQGTRLLLPALGHVEMALVGEPTQMQPALGERGLVVLDCTAHGVRGHAARNEGVNALYKAIEDIRKLQSYRFEKRSSLLGDIKLTVTQIEAGTQHNVVPDVCKFVVDVRTTDAYTNEETVALLQQLLDAEATPRSTRVRASAIEETHPLVQAACRLGRRGFVSPTTSDMALMYDIPSLKMGVGDSARSHTADEFVYEQEIVEGVDLYIRYLEELKEIMK